MDGAHPQVIPENRRKRGGYSAKTTFEEEIKWLKEVKVRRSRSLSIVHRYSATEAVELVKKTNTAKFDATVEAAFRLGVDLRKLTNKSVVQLFFHTVLVKYNVY